MKKAVALLFIAFGTGIAADKAEKFDIYAVAGYGFAMGGRLDSSYTRSITGTASSFSNLEQKYFNYGLGMKLEAGTDIFLTDYLPIQAGVILSSGTPSFTTDKTILASGTSEEQKSEYKYSAIGIKLMAVPRLRILKQIDLHAGAGIGLYFGTLDYTTTFITTQTQIETGHLNSVPAFALLESVGADYSLTSFLAAFGEVGFEEMDFKWSEKKVDRSWVKNPPTTVPSPDHASGINWQLRAGVKLKAF